MKKIFILGSGFSKSISNHMPTILGLSEYISKNIVNIPGDKDIYRNFYEDSEKLLSYLFQPMPWKSEEEIHIDKAAFIAISRLITKYIIECEEKTFTEVIPDWANKYIEYLHNKKSTIATMNYDTIIERLSRSIIPNGNKDEKIDTSNFYRMPVSTIRGRNNFLWGMTWYDTFLLLKLHGSINWFYSGEENVNGQQVYYVPVITDSPKTDIYDSIVESSLIDLEPMIIPPVAEKSSFYRTSLVKALWRNFRNALIEADEIYCVGYSIPKTDSTMNTFLKAFSRSEQKVFIINNANSKIAEELLLHYSEVFSDCKIEKRYLGISNSVEKMVLDLLIE